jgi:hypothetical protein
LSHSASPLKMSFEKKNNKILSTSFFQCFKDVLYCLLDFLLLIRSVMSPIPLVLCIQYGLDSWPISRLVLLTNLIVMWISVVHLMFLVLEICLNSWIYKFIFFI